MKYRYLPEPPEEAVALLLIVAAHVQQATDPANPFGSVRNMAVAFNFAVHPRLLAYVEACTPEAIRNAAPAAVQFDMTGAEE